MNEVREVPQRWYQGITRYQWLVLIIASLGWVFDVFEGQIFVASMNEAMPALLSPDQRNAVAYYNNITLGAFLVGGALGGVVFGILADRIGRTRTMIFTIIMYSVFTLVSAWSTAWWHMAVFRFLVAMGVGGEWAVASAMVAEVFPKSARAWSSSIFHASSVFGTLLAVAAGFFIVSRGELRIPLPWSGESWVLSGWRVGFMLGVVPALLIIWIRTSLREPEAWTQAQAAARQGGGRQLGSFFDLFHYGLLGRILLGVGLAAVGLATFWGAHIYGKDLLKRETENAYLAQRIAEGGNPSMPDPLPQILAEVRSEAEAGNSNAVDLLRKRLKDQPKLLAFLLEPYVSSVKQWEMIGMLLVTVGGGLGLVSFGPTSERLGRRGAFLLYHLGGLAAALIVFQLITGRIALMIALPIFGFLTLGMHAGYAVYFPELFPTRLRSTGAGFCFNVGRIVAAPILFLSGWMQRDWGFTLENAASILSLLFPLGALLLLLAPETRGQELPE